MVVKCGPVCGCIVVHEQIRVHLLLGTSLYCEIKYHRTVTRDRGKCGEVVDEEWLVTEKKGPGEKSSDLRRRNVLGGRVQVV